MTRAQPPRRLAVLVLLFVGLVAAGVGAKHLRSSPMPQTATSATAEFRHLVIDPRGPREPWGKAAGDLNGDGRPDLILGGNGGGGLVWYENPSWKRHSISNEPGFRTDIEVVDIDRDGKNDVVALTEQALVWYRNGDWAKTEIDRVQLHDVEVADLDGDGKIDIVGRNQTGFNGDGDKIYVYHQHAPDRWRRRVLHGPDGEGLVLADIDGDGRRDIVVNGYWFQNPGRVNGEWRSRRYAASWTWPHAFVAVGDIDGDGRSDIALAPSEPAGDRYRLSWFQAPANVHANTPWREHVVDADIETVHHFVGVADIDGDARQDLVVAEMYQGADPDEIRVYRNLGKGERWRREAIATVGSHSMRLLDVDGDGDIDLFGANWSGPEQSAHLWLNRACDTPADWKRHVIDPQRPGRALFVAAADLDRDGWQDVVTGAWWYRNPGSRGTQWQRQALGAGARNMVAVHDFDDDGVPDILAARGIPYENDEAGFVWARNHGSGSFTIYDNLPAGEGDFLQGVAVGRFAPGRRLEVALSWHEQGRGVQMLSVPREPRAAIPGDRAAARWPWRRIADRSQDEQLSAGDIDRDGDLDLLLGTVWLRNDRTHWTPFRIASDAGAPDRNRLVDINADGRLDAVVGFEAISVPGDVVWYEQGRNPEQPWTRHLIGSVIGPMSLDVGDVDGDGDVDVVVGEHNLKRPQDAALYVFENLDGRGGRWQRHTVWVGDEHHDGAQFADIDGDGDLDIVSIGWGHNAVLWYENVGRHKCRPARDAAGRT